jgi:integrase
MNKNLNLLFYLKRAKIKKNGEAPIYLRITVDGIRAETSTGRSIIPNKWDSNIQMQKGRSEQARTLNNHLDNIKTTINHDFNILNEAGTEFTVEILKNRLNGKKVKSKGFVEVFEENNQLVKLEENNKYATTTVSQYQLTLTRLKEFVIKEYKCKDLSLEDLDLIFIRKFETYLRTEYNASHNTVVKYLKQLKRVAHFAMELGYTDRDPFAGHKSSYREANRGYLTQEELDRIEKHVFKIDRLDRVKDVFLFASYTGISYSDLKKLTPQDIQNGIDGKPWIILERAKTGVRSPIPLLPKALEIVEKYKHDPECITEGKLLPVKSNQKLNSYLAEIAELCEINKHITMHLGRHTFATTVTLTQGVPFETVSKILGHKSLSTTQIYSKVVDLKISEDMERLKQRIS